MQAAKPAQDDQTKAATAALCGILGDALLAIYLHGSAVRGGLRPRSDIDLLAIVDSPMADGERRDLLSALLAISGPYRGPSEGPRCIEVMVFVRSALFEQDVSAQAEFVYGEWLRNEFEKGERPVPVRDPENTLVLAQARRESRPLFGPDASELLLEISLKHVRRAMRDALPSLFDGLRGDERNVLLTLARMWRTARTGEFVSKDEAAAWAVPQLPGQDAAILDFARRAYLGEVDDHWEGRQDALQRTAKYLRQRVSELL